MRETEKYYFFWRHQFGQWTLRDMTDPDGILYNCCEQYMMYKKAMLFKDLVSAEKIIQEKSPKNQQVLGRTIANFDQSIWDNQKFGIVWYGNFLKFSQHNDLKKRLLETGDKIIAEASPYDLVWGVGLAAEDDNILDKINWQGENLLGRVLMSVREAVKK